MQICRNCNHKAWVSSIYHNYFPDVVTTVWLPSDLGTSHQWMMSAQNVILRLVFSPFAIQWQFTPRPTPNVWSVNNYCYERFSFGCQSQAAKPTNTQNCRSLEHIVCSTRLRYLLSVSDPGRKRKLWFVEFDKIDKMEMCVYYKVLSVLPAVSRIERRHVNVNIIRIVTTCNNAMINEWMQLNEAGQCHTHSHTHSLLSVIVWHRIPLVFLSL